MSYVTISTWNMGSDMPEAERNKIMQDQFMPALKGFGATHAMTVDTGGQTAAIITVYPDLATRDAAAKKIAGLREKGTTTFAAQMTGEMMGEVVAES